MSNTVNHPSSFRDPSGFIFEKDNILYRQVNNNFKEHFDLFIQSGLYDKLVKKGWLIPHDIISQNLTGGNEYYTTIKPEKVEFISYPYEWSFDMLKDAALLTLHLVKESMQSGLILKDASPYNVQWHKGRLVFIDSLSFEKYTETPWIAYRQFCEAFLGPLLIMHYSKKQMPGLLLAWPDGIPLMIIQSLLPKRSRFSLHTYLHIHLHARLSNSKKNEGAGSRVLSKQKMLNLIGSLEILVSKLKTPVQKTNWSEYYDEASKRNDYLEQKKKIITTWINAIDNLKTAVDVGANEGEFSKLLAEKGVFTIASDLDAYCINNLYRYIKNSGQKNIQPLVIDLSAPTPSIGLNNKERDSFVDRTKAELVMALALVHHLAIGKNIPFERIAELFDQLGKKLIIEFVPKDDEKVKLMLSRKKDIYTGYDEANFAKAFERYFTVIDRKPIPGSGRILYFMQKN